MSNWQKFSLVGVLFILCILAFLSWYKFHYSMSEAKSFVITTKNPQYKILIATQGSKFKDAVVSGLIIKLSLRPVSIHVIDVSGLSSVKAELWNAIVILHTWESWKPQIDAKLFVEKQPNLNNIIVLTTSGEGAMKMEQVDAITSASVMSDVPVLISEIMRRIDLILSHKKKAKVLMTA